MTTSKVLMKKLHLHAKKHEKGYQNMENFILASHQKNMIRPKDTSKNGLFAREGKANFTNKEKRMVQVSGMVDSSKFKKIGGYQ